MPELPEVEVTRRGIEEPLQGARILSVELGKPLRWPLGVVPQALHGAHIEGVGRRGKYLWLQLEHGRGGLLIHLGMSGSLSLLRQHGAPAGVHDHFEMRTTAGLLRLTDPRRFGAVVWSASLQVEPAARLLSRLGAEPFDAAFGEAEFHAALRGRRTPIKLLLLAGEVIVGAGNIYACEALHIADVHPATPAGRLSRARAARLLAAVRQTLQRALDLGGSTLRDFRDVHGTDGAFQSQALVYDREGQPCRRCGRPIRRLVQAQRSTYYCPGCQHR